MEKTNTRGTTGATGVVVALEPVSKMAADIIDGRALGGNLRQRRLQEVDIPKPENLDGRDVA